MQLFLQKRFLSSPNTGFLKFLENREIEDYGKEFIIWIS